MKAFFILCGVSLLSTSVFAQISALGECRNISNVNARVACYDAMVDSQQPGDSSQTTPVITSVPALVQEIPATGISPSSASSGTTRVRPEVSPETRVRLFGATEEVTREFIEEDIGVIQLDYIEAVVEDVSSAAYNRLIVRLDNGHTWQQTDSRSLRIREGDQIIVRSGRMGAFFLEKASGSRSIRVKRVL
ncbi:MAG: hypothetical protein COA96_04465 [SAR86 cluster bacterium]|uniref:Uncharacterized protein n=1 Tax=SAR86 cluster bacterium TaxID=2030880 RepID=A0A2A5B5P5_9GAMM|nr:MAG: hypothetical protein COA96_04465 [SAR86 cluster bacterium]